MRPGIKRLQHLEALGHHQRRVVGQHDAAGADAQGLRHRRDLPDHDIGRRARDRRQIMMFGHPIAPETQAIGVPRKVERIAQGLCAAVELAETGERSRMDSGIMRMKLTLTCERRLFARMIRRMINGTRERILGAHRWRR